jgi:hypothetical protein
MTLYPQGHGDAWGHYLTALRKQYDLLRHPYFNWVSRSEFYNLQDIVMKVDFLDERKFAQVAAAKAKAGAEVVTSTYREHYVEDADRAVAGLHRRQSGPRLGRAGVGPPRRDRAPTSTGSPPMPCCRRCIPTRSSRASKRWIVSPTRISP